MSQMWEIAGNIPEEMKLEILESDYNQLSDDAKDRYSIFCHEHNYETYLHHDETKEYVSLWTIGQLIEFLYCQYGDEWPKHLIGSSGEIDQTIKLCDVLWRTVKKILEQN